MNRLALTVALVLFSTKLTVANVNKEVFELSLANNTPQRSLITKTKLRCALACLEQSECHGFNYGLPANGADFNCFMYDWLTLGEGDVHVFAIPQEESTPDLLTRFEGQLTVELSTTHNSYDGSKAIDGLYDTFIHTLEEVSPWMQIDMHEIAAVRAVEIWNRESHNIDVELRLKNVLISVAVASDAEGFGERFSESECSFSQGTQALVKLHWCYDAMNGRFVRITAVEANAVLNLFEVEIFV